MDENLYRLDVAAQRLAVHTETIKRWASSGKAALIELPGGPATVMSITQYAQNLVNNTQSVAALDFE